MEDASLQGGLVVCARWRLRGRLSEAPEGRVWEAETIETYERVAIKFFARPAAGDAGARRRFEREVRSIQKVRSPYVLPIVDHGHTDSGLPFIVTELLKGQDLGQLLGQERVLGLIETHRIVDQVCRGLSSIHAAGLAYGDLQPENVFVSSAGDRRASVRLLGFGLASPTARESTRLSPDGTVLGIGPFVSPEQLQGQVRADAGTDLWALGVLAYRMLTGVWPFDVHNWVTLAQSIQRGAVKPASAWRRDLPAELDRWFGQVLQPQLARRFRSVEDARAAFERIALVYTAGMLAQPSPRPGFGPEPVRNPSIIVHPPSSRSAAGSRWRTAAWAAVLVGLSSFALRVPLSRAVGGVLEPLRDMARQLAAPAAAPPELLPNADPGAITVPVEVEPPQLTAASGAPLMSPPPPIVQSVSSRPPRARRPRAARSEPNADVMAQPPPEPRPREGSAIASLDDPSPDLPAPSHVYRGF